MKPTITGTAEPHDRRTIFRFSAQAWYRRVLRSPQPPRDAIKLLLIEIGCELEKAELRPIALSCESFVPGSFADHPDEHLARLTIEAEFGELRRPLVCWYEWQHPRWRWAQAQAADIDGTVTRLVR